MTQTTLESRENRQKQNDQRALSLLLKFHSCYLGGVPTANLELGLTYFSDFENVELQLS